jgi:DNA-binding Lrp family transcriptional regulator
MVAAPYDERDFQILKFLAAHPTATIAEIARRLDCRLETVSNHLRLMRQRKLYGGTIAMLCYQKLDLAYVPVLVQAPIGSLNTLYRVARAHPYIHFSVRTLGSTDGAFLVFTVPRKASRLLIEFLDEVASRGIITNHRLYVCDDTRRDFLQPDLRVFDRRSGTWVFNFNRWAEADQPTATNEAQPQVAKARTVRPELYSLDGVDIHLLSILSDDAKAGIPGIARATHLPAHTVRRKKQSLEEYGFIISYRAMIALSKFHLQNTVLFNCMTGPEDAEACRRKLIELPFPGFCLPVENGFLCQATLPAEGLPPVHRFLAKHCSKVDVSWFDLPTSETASLNWKAFDGNYWRIDSPFLLDEPVQTIEKH